MTVSVKFYLAFIRCFSCIFLCMYILDEKRFNNGSVLIVLNEDTILSVNNYFDD